MLDSVIVDILLDDSAGQMVSCPLVCELTSCSNCVIAIPIFMVNLSLPCVAFVIVIVVCVFYLELCYPEHLLKKSLFLILQPLFFPLYSNSVTCA